MNCKEIAFIYDFDSTLAYGSIQEYSFIPSIGMKSCDFWKEVQNIKIKHNMQDVLAYMFLMLKKASEKSVLVNEEAFKEFGKNVSFYPGVIDWFSRINNYGKELGLNIKHYIISSGIKEMIEGTKIAPFFEKIYGCTFLYDKEGNAVWPAVAVNYTNKTQFLYRINKGIYDVYDDSINQKMDSSKKRVPFDHMIYFGDGLTDVPCMKLVKEHGGIAISVYEDENKRVLADTMLYDERVNFISKADYTEGSSIDEYIKLILKKISKENI